MRFFLLYLLLSMLFTECKEQQTDVVIATSANMRYAMQEIANSLEDECNCKVDLIIASSGKIAAQIERGAPYDIFVSADLRYPTYLYKKTFSLDKPKVYARGQLALWSITLDTLNTKTTLEDDKIKKVVIANPNTAPYGRAAIEYLKNKKIYTKVKPKLVFGENIAQCNNFVKTKAVDLGFVSYSVICSHPNQGTWQLLNIDDYPPILQCAIRIKHTNKKNDTIVKFCYDFLFSKKARVILDKYGYLRPNR